MGGVNNPMKGQGTYSERLAHACGTRWWRRSKKVISLFNEGL